jgi:pyruvate formate lyase activating enzyme
VPEREACYYYSGEGLVECLLCPWHCRLRPGQSGQCGVRVNRDGVLYTLNYGEVTALALDPIEKKPLYHFRPGTQILSLGTFGCNLHCRFCQNWQISQNRPLARTLTPSEAVQLAVDARSQGNIGLAYTYNEPFIWFEYLREVMPLARSAGLVNVLVTNGLVEKEPLGELLPCLDAVNVDIKAMSERFYREQCQGQGLPARQTVERLWGQCAVEITNLLIPGLNDSIEEIQALVDWAAGVSPYLPVHFSAYHPDYQCDSPATPAETLQRAVAIARQKLAYVYAGNAWVAGARDTNCPECGQIVVKRQGMNGDPVGLTAEGRCQGCGADCHCYC